MAKPPPKGIDRRVQRTRRMLREALVSLILERGWDGVTVQDVCDRADVGRSTFYTHFADKEELLVGGLEDLGENLRAEFAARGDSGPLGFVRGLLEHAHEHRRLFRAIFDRRGGQVVQHKFRDQVVELTRRDLAESLPSGSETEAAARFLAGALLELLMWWLDAPRPLPPQDVERMFLRMACPCIDALR